VIPHVKTARPGGSVAWRQDDQGFYYTRYPHAGGSVPPPTWTSTQQVWFHKLGTAVSADTYSLGKDFPRIAEIFAEHFSATTLLLAQMPM